MIKQYFNSTKMTIYLNFMLSSLMAFASISTDVYLPAFPTMRAVFHENPNAIEWTISGFLIGFSIGQLFWGAISDRYGRKSSIVIGLIIFILGSWGCAQADSAWELIRWRAMQAFGACIGPVLSRAMVGDIFRKDEAAKKLSLLVLLMGVAPILGPLIGGQILLWGSWRWIFWVLVMVGVILFIAAINFPETLSKERRVTTPLKYVLNDYVSLLKNKELMKYALAGTFYYSAIYAYVAGVPTVFIKYYQIPAEYFGVIFGVNVFGMMIVNFINGRLLSRTGANKLFQYGVGIMLISSLLVMLCSLTGWGGAFALEVFIFICVSMNGLIVANSVAIVLDLSPKAAGAVSALTGAMYYGSGIISSYLVGLFYDGTPAAMGVIVGLSGVGCFVTIIGLKNLVKSTTSTL